MAFLYIRSEVFPDSTIYSEYQQTPLCLPLLLAF